MSNKPHPVALTAAMLALRKAMDHMDRAKAGLDTALETSGHEWACLASDIHRIAPACQRHAVAMCNGEWRDGQRDYWNRMPDYAGALGLQDLDASIEAYGKRLGKRLANLNESLAQLSIQAVRQGDPRGLVLRLVSTDPSRHLLGHGGEWLIC